MSAATHKRKSYTIKLKLEVCKYAENSRTPYIPKKNLMWQVGDVLIETRSPIQAGGSRAFVLIEAGGCIRSFTVCNMCLHTQHN